MKTAQVGPKVEVEIEVFEAVRSVSWLGIAVTGGKKIFVHQLTQEEVRVREKNLHPTDVVMVSLTPNGEKKPLPKTQLLLWQRQRAIIPAD